MVGQRPKFSFLLDENFPAPSGKFLQSLGHNVISVSSSRQLTGQSDLKVLSFANKSERILIALDKDFSSNSSLSGSICKGKGVVLIKTSCSEPEKVKLALKHLLKIVTPSKLEGKICHCSVDKVSFRAPEV